MSMFSWAFKSNKELSDAEIPALFTLPLAADVFIKSDILNTYSKILTDVAERSHGLSETQEPLLWDSCVQTKTNEGLITLLAEAMTHKRDLFLVYSKSVGVIRKATADEERQIKADYEKTGESPLGVFISFKGYRRTEMLQIYSSFEYCVLASLNKTLNVAKSVQFKISDLRQSVSLADAGIAKEQAKSIAEAMRNGNDVLLDAKDAVTTATPDMSATEKAMQFLAAKKAFILGLPLSYVEGEQTPGIGSTGEADMRAVERGLRQYFVSIIQPVFKVVFGVECEFKSQDFRQMTTALETLKAFELTSDDYLSKESKRNVTARVFDLDPEKEKKALETEQKEKANANVSQETVLNGAQVTALVEIVEKVSLGLIPRESAVEMVSAAFQVPPAQAQKILGKAGLSFKPQVSPPTATNNSAAPGQPGTTAPAGQGTRQAAV